MFFFKGIIRPLKNVTLSKEFFRTCRGPGIYRVSIMSHVKPPRLAALTLKDVVHDPVSTLNKIYGDTDNISRLLQDILKDKLQVDPITSVKTEFLYDKLWTCTINIPYKYCDQSEDQSFQGRGITKKTAEHNCKLSALLWLKNKSPGYSKEKKISPPLSLIRLLSNGASSDSCNIHSNQTLDKKLPTNESTITSKLNTEEPTIKSNINKRLQKYKINSIEINCDNNTSPEVIPNNKILIKTNQSNEDDIQSKKNTVNWRPVRWHLGLTDIKTVESNYSKDKNATKYSNVFDTKKNPLENSRENPYKFDWQPVCKFLGLQSSSNSSTSSLDIKNTTTQNNNLHLNQMQTLISDGLTQKRMISTSCPNNNSIKETNHVSENEQKPVKDLRKLLNQNVEEPVKELMFKHSPESTKASKLFPLPKAMLNNFYQILTQQLKNKFDLSPSYKTEGGAKNNSLWVCTYRLNWPMDCKVMAKGHTKKEASYYAALQALMFLQQENKMTKDGYPISFTKEQTEELKKDQMDLNIKEDGVSKMKDIIDIYNRHILPNIADLKIEPNVKDTVVFTQEEPLNLSVIHSQKYLGFDMYLAKEKVDLPIAKQKKEFMDLYENNQVVIVKGEPGCGKSTRVPQYILESWAYEAQPGEPCRIAVTQPRKIAAISLAERVSQERMETPGSIVGYQVRLDSKFQARTGRILYCTTGILLRHFQADPLLRKFTCVVLDEAHERDVNADLLMNLLKKAVQENENLKVVVMSATIDTDLFQQYFSNAAVLNVPGMTYPVSRYFLDNCRGLEVEKTLKMCDSQYPSVVHDDVVQVIKYIHKNKPEGAILVFLSGWDDIVKIKRSIPESHDLFVLPLHSKLQRSDQLKIFNRPPPGIRKIILATNIAETSITIDDIVYVVDAGIFKSQVYDVQKSVNVIDNKWISKASVSQRSGRAGRCQPGESYHLYTRARFDMMADYNVPEILETSLTKIVLDSKMFSNNRNAVEWMNELPTPPENKAVVQAVNALKDLELLDNEENLTPLGRTLINFQLEPKLAKTMVNSVIYNCTTPIVDIVTLFSGDVDIFDSVLSEKESIKWCKLAFSQTSDHLAMLRMFEKWLEIYEEVDPVTESRFTTSNKLNPHKLRYVEKLRAIHFEYLRNGLDQTVPLSDNFSDSDEIVKGVLFGGVGNLLRLRNWDIVKQRLKNKTVLITKNGHRAQITQESVNNKKKKLLHAKFLTYINETLSTVQKTSLIRETTVIPELTVILFSNCDITISEINSSSEELKNKVILDLKNIGSFICDKDQAQILLKCKEALRDCYKYYVHQLTTDCNNIPQVDDAWEKILVNLDQVLNSSK